MVTLCKRLFLVCIASWFLYLYDTVSQFNINLITQFKEGIKELEQLKTWAWKYKKPRQMCCDDWKKIRPENCIQQPGAFTYKMTTDIDFAEHQRVQDDIPVVKNTFDLLIMANDKN